VRRGLGVAILLGALLATGCSAGSEDVKSGEGTTSSTPSASTGGTPTTSGDAESGIGTLILITRTGLRPRLLIAPFGNPIVWRNVSNKTASVRFDNFGRKVESGPISPGESWSFNPRGELSIIYHATSSKRFRGQLQVQDVGSY